MILILQRGAIPNGERKGRWYFLCPECGKPARELLPRPGVVRQPITAAAMGFSWAPWLEVPELRVPVPGRPMNLLGSLPWACRRCRDAPSEASRLDKQARAERRLAKRATDARTGHRRPGESWAEEMRREQRARAARHLLEASDTTRLRRVLDFRLPRPVR